MAQPVKRPSRMTNVRLDADLRAALERFAEERLGEKNVSLAVRKILTQRLVGEGFLKEET